jgi:hypothetical protein
MTPSSDDRRRWDRLDTAKPCKVFLPVSQRFAPGRTCNVSRGGALVTIETARPLCPGDPIDITISFSRLPLVPADRMLRGRITRAETFDADRQLVAIEFDEPLAELAAA